MDKKTFQFDPPETLYLGGATEDGLEEIAVHDVTELTVEKDRRVVYMNWESEDGDTGSVTFVHHNIEINIEEVAEWYFPNP